MPKINVHNINELKQQLERLQKIKEYHQKGYSKNAIAKELKMTYSTVWLHIERFEFEDRIKLLEEENAKLRAEIETLKKPTT